MLNFVNNISPSVLIVVLSVLALICVFIKHNLNMRIMYVPIVISVVGIIFAILTTVKA